MWVVIGLLGALAFSFVASVALLAWDEEPGLRNLRQIRERPEQQLVLRWRARTARGTLARGFEGSAMDASHRFAQGAAKAQ